MVTATSSAVAVDTHAEADEDVIRQVLDGDSGMFELLMRRYNERVYRAARAIPCVTSRRRRTSCSRPMSTPLRICGSSTVLRGSRPG